MPPPPDDEVATASALEASGPRPYKGADSYQVEDRHLFFGRGADAVHLNALILTERLCLLHAPSGAGKTSLLNAEIMPELEDRGWITVRALPHNDPQAFLKMSTLFRVLPSPAAEIEAIRRVGTAVAPYIEGAVEDASLRELRRMLDTQVPKSSEAYLHARRSLSSELTCADGRVLSSDDVSPFFTRFINARRGPTLLARQVDALARFSGRTPFDYDTVDQLARQLATTKTGDLEAFFDHAETRRAHAEQVHFLTDGEFSLLQFFDRLCSGWGSVFEEFSLVLVLDQFEELFTRFVDQRHRGVARDPTLPDWELRPAYFEALAELLPQDDRSAAYALPLKIVISMRDDFIARLDQLENRTSFIHRLARYHLDLLQVGECRQVIEEPAKTFNFRYDPAVLEEFLEALPTEQDKIEPGHVQIVCDRLYDQIQKIGNDQDGNDNTEERIITRDDLRAAGEIAGILEHHFEDFLEKFDDEKDRIEILDVLEPLMTINNKRNIVERDELVYKPFRDPELRKGLLLRLTNARIVRVENRLNGEFAEITHEFLIAAVKDSIARALLRQPYWRNLRAAFARLDRIEATGFRGAATEKLEEREYDALWWYRDRLRIRGPRGESEGDLESGPAAGAPVGDGPPADEGSWQRSKDTRWLAELLLRTAVLLGRPEDERASWGSLVDEHAMVPQAGALLEQLDTRATEQRWLDHLELRELVELRPEQVVGANSAQFVIASAIRNTNFGLTRAVTRWVLEHSNA